MDVASESDISGAAEDAYSDGSSSVDVPALPAVPDIVSHPIRGQAENLSNISNDHDSLSSSSDPIPQDVFSLSESSNDDIAAADAFSSSDLDNENLENADVVSDDSSDGGLGGRIMAAILGGQFVAEGDSGVDITAGTAPSFPLIPGPFTPQYFSNIPSTWLDVASDDEGNNPNDPDED